MRRQPGGQVRRVGKIEQSFAESLQILERQVGNARLLGLRHCTDAPSQLSQRQIRLALAALLAAFSLAFGKDRLRGTGLLDGRMGRAPTWARSSQPADLMAELP